MSMAANDPIRSDARGTPEAAITFAQSRGAKRMPDVRAYLKEVFRLAPAVGIDPALVVAQGAEETGNWTSDWWVERLNPAGIGITGDPAQDAVSGTWASGADAARAQIVHLFVYAVGPVPNGHTLARFRDLDPRYQAAIDAGFGGVAPKLSGLSGRWAEDPGYAGKIAERGNAIFSNLSVIDEHQGATTMVFGRVPHPDYIDRIIPDFQNGAWDDLGQRQPKGICYHRQVGFNWGTDGWFRRGVGVSDGLTDYGIERSTGEILRWNHPLGKAVANCPGVGGAASANRSGWASGPWESPPGGDGHAYVAKFGENGINRDLVSLEIDGMYEDSISETALQEIALLSAHWADWCKIPWKEYPNNPHTGLLFTYWHSEFQNHKPCPGDVVRGLTDDIIKRTKEIMRKYQQEEADGEGPQSPKAPPLFDGTDKTVGGITFHAAGRRITVAVEELNCRVNADPASPITRQPLRAGQRFTAWYWITGVSVGGENRWWVTRHGSRLWAGGTVEKPGDT